MLGANEVSRSWIQAILPLCVNLDRIRGIQILQGFYIKFMSCMLDTILRNHLT